MKSKLLTFDAFAKTVDDARIKTASGGTITLLCLLVVLILIGNEYREYSLIIQRPELVVDRDINKKLVMNLDVTFPNLPCGVITMDIVDSTGDIQMDILRSGFEKYRIINGKEVLDDLTILGHEVTLEVLAKGLDEGEQGKCGSCYGALPQDKNQYCCNDCETIRMAYAAVEWAFYDGSDIEQCESEGYVEILKQSIERNEGCRVKGSVQVSRIAGNLHFAPGSSFYSNGKHWHDTSLYTKHPTKFNFDHTINHFSFGLELKTDESSPQFTSTQSLNGVSTSIKSKTHVFSYFLKVVASRFELINGQKLETNQFSVIKHDRPLEGGKDLDHKHTMHARGGVPGVFFYFDISPLKIITREVYAKSWSGFLLGVFSSIAGVLMVGVLVDRSVWAAEKVINNKKNM